jgi:hypothetical protein
MGCPDHILLLFSSSTDKDSIFEDLKSVTSVHSVRVDRITGASAELGLLVGVSISVVGAIRAVLVTAIKNRRRITVRYKGIEFRDITDDSLSLIIKKLLETSE